MAELAAAEARAAAAEDEVETLREALAACAQPTGATWDASLITALEQERDAALDARDAAEEARERAERQVNTSIDSVKDGAKGALSQLQRDAKAERDAAVKQAVADVKTEAKKKIAAAKEKLRQVQEFAKKRDEACQAAEQRLTAAETAKTTAVTAVEQKLARALSERDAARKRPAPAAAAPVTMHQSDDAQLHALKDALENEREEHARLRADFEKYKRRSNKVLRGAKKPRPGGDNKAAAATKAVFVAADAAVAAAQAASAGRASAHAATAQAIRVAARLARAKAQEATRRARAGMKAAPPPPAAAPPAPAVPRWSWSCSPPTPAVGGGSR